MKKKKKFEFKEEKWEYEKMEKEIVINLLNKEEFSLKKEEIEYEAKEKIAEGNAALLLHNFEVNPDDYVNKPLVFNFKKTSED